MGIHNSFGFHQEHKGLRNPKGKKPTKSNMKVFTTVCTMVALASAESQLLVAQNDVNYLRSPNVGKMSYKGYVDYVDTSSATHPLVNNYVLTGEQPQVTLRHPQVTLSTRSCPKSGHGTLAWNSPSLSAPSSPHPTTATSQRCQTPMAAVTNTRFRSTGTARDSHSSITNKSSRPMSRGLRSSYTTT